MKTLWTIMPFSILLLIGCEAVQTDPIMPKDEATNAKYPTESYNTDFSATSQVEDLLTESYPWRRAYAEFLWDREKLNIMLEEQFYEISGSNYEYYNTEIGMLFIDSDDIPELLVYFRNEAPPAPEYYAIYHYNSATKEGNSHIELYYSNYIPTGSTTWKYLPHGNAFYTGYFKVMGGFYGYDLYFLENGKWICWDEMPVITSRILAEQYGVFDRESFNVHDSEPEFSDQWREPELLDIWTSLYYGDMRHSIIEAMFGSDAIADLPKDTD